jgi:exonuclease VII large subunit
MMETSPESPAPVRVVSEALKSYLDRLSPIWIEGEISEINERSGMLCDAYSMKAIHQCQCSSFSYVLLPKTPEPKTPKPQFN